MIRGSYSEKDDNDLVADSLKGDKRAFSEIVNRYQNMVARTVKGMLGDTEVADDIGQDVFIKLYHSLPSYRGEAKLSTYIQRIAINFSINELRKRKRIISIFSQKINNEIHEFDIPDSENEEKSDARELVNKALMNLDPKFRVIVSMRMLQGYSTKETAEILELPLGTVLSRLSRAQEQLRKILDRL